MDTNGEILAGGDRQDGASAKDVEAIVAEVRAAKEVHSRLHGEAANTIRVSRELLSHPRWEEIRAELEAMGLKFKGVNS